MSPVNGLWVQTDKAGQEFSLLFYKYQCNMVDLGPGKSKIVTLWTFRERVYHSWFRQPLVRFSDTHSITRSCHCCTRKTFSGSLPPPAIEESSNSLEERLIIHNLESSKPTSRIGGKNRPLASGLSNL